MAKIEARLQSALMKVLISSVGNIMARYKPPRRNYKSFWSYLMDWIAATLLFGTFIAIARLLDFDWIIYNHEFNAYLTVVLLFRIVAQIWRWLFFGTVTGKVVIEKNKDLSKQDLNLDISLRAIDYKVEVKSISENTKGEFLFQCKIPVGRKFTLGVDVGNRRVITEDIGEFEGVRWLFGNAKFGLPISSGEAIAVDLVVPNIPENTIPTHRPARRTYSYHYVPEVILGTVMIIVMFLGPSTEIWSRFFEGSIYGQVTREDGNTNRLENIEVYLGFTGDSTKRIPKKWRPVLTNSNGEYRFDNCVSVNSNTVRITVKYETETPGYYREIRNRVEGIEGVRRFLGLPISSGIPKRVDFVIPDIPPPIIGN